MKYARLTKEQMEELQEEFTRFLATQSITAAEWEQLKSNEPALAEAELDVFSDLIWEGALNAAKFLENTSEDQVICIAIEPDKMQMIHARISAGSANLTTLEGRRWLLKNIAADSVHLQTGTKVLSEGRNQEVFKLIEQGAVITNGALFEALDQIVNY